MMSFPASSTLVLITGANQGIGLATARLLAIQPNYHILLGSRDAGNGLAAALPLQAEGLAVTPITIDVTSSASIAAAAALVESQYGRLDVLINNAGIALESRAADLTKRQIWEDMFAVNVFGAALTTDAFIPLLEKSSKPARVIFVSSGLGSLSDYADAGSAWAGLHAPVYRSSKAAMNMVMLGYARQWEEKGWRVNAVSPGYTGTYLNGFRGTGSVEDAAAIVGGLALEGEEGGTGRFWGEGGAIKW